MKTKSVFSLHLLAFVGAALLLLAAAPSRVHAGFVFTLSQVGGNVVVNGNGKLNLTALTLQNSAFTGLGSVLISSEATLAIDPANANLRQYSGITGVTSWGSASASNAPATASGDAVVISSPYLYVPVSYVSGAALSDTMTFTGQTVSSLGFTPGTYTYTWGTGANADSLTVTSVVPEPSTWTLFIAGGASLLGVLLRRRQA